MARQFPIWVSHPSQSKSFGVRDSKTLTVYAGTSASTSYPFADVGFTHEERRDGARIYTLYIDGVTVKRCIIMPDDNQLHTIVKPENNI